MDRTPFQILLKRFNVVLAICLILASLSTGCTTASPTLRELSYGLTLAHTPSLALWPGLIISLTILSIHSLGTWYANETEPVKIR